MICQPTVDGCLIKTEALQQILPAAPELRSRLSRYANFQCLRVSQIAACNRFHEIEQRLARWLLMSQDRVGSASLPFTHEFLASMLGTGPSDAKSGRLSAGNWGILSTLCNLSDIGYR